MDNKTNITAEEQWLLKWIDIYKYRINHYKGQVPSASVEDLDDYKAMVICQNILSSLSLARLECGVLCHQAY